MALGLGVIVLVAGVVAWNYFIGSASITLEPAEGVSMTLGTPAHEGIEAIITQTNTPTTLRVAKGTYALLLEQAGHQSKLTTVNISQNTHIPSETLEPNVTTLQQLQRTEQTALLAVVASKTPPGYHVATQSLYADGTWAGVKLAAGSQDDLRIILHKQAGAWVSLAGPGMVLAKADFPQIPGEILSQVNNSL
jgi:hypothetical protein